MQVDAPTHHSSSTWPARPRLVSDEMPLPQQFIHSRYRPTSKRQQGCVRLSRYLSKTAKCIWPCDTTAELRKILGEADIVPAAIAAPPKSESGKDK